MVRWRWWWESNKEEEMEGLTGGERRDKVGCGRQDMAGDSFWSMYSVPWTIDRGSTGLYRSIYYQA